MLGNVKHTGKFECGCKERMKREQSTAKLLRIDL